MAYNTAALSALRRFANQSGDPVAFVASALVESNANPKAVGDNGHSIGLFQEYDRGRGAGLSVAQREDPFANAKRAAREFSQYHKRGLSGAELAYSAQRPADHAGYVRAVNSRMAEARKILGGAYGDSSQGVTATRNGQTTAQPDQGPDLNSLAMTALQGNQHESFTSRMGKAYISQQLSKQASQVGGTEAAATVAANVGKIAAPQVGKNGKVPSVVKAAEGVLGTPYSWGGGGPGGPSKGFAQGAGITGFDCSSLMQYAYAKMGIQIPRTTYGQIKAGHAVALNKLQPGDLLFPHAGHVQMFVGDGKVIEAPQTGGHVQIVPMRSSYIAARRIL